MATIGSFLREKMQNMRAWLIEAGYDAPPLMSDILLVAVAQTLHDEHLKAIEARSFEALQVADLPDDITAPLTFISARPELHDKFWRYLKLFSDIVSNDE